MKGVDTIMARCPLKHEIRKSLWGAFIKGLGIKPIKYLTLYSPPLMDVKYLHKTGYITANNNKFINVVGVSLDGKAIAETNSQTANRLDLLLQGNINVLLSEDGYRSENKKKLISKFPFDVVNLDYTDTLHSKSKNEELSPHFKAIDNLLRLQYKGKKDEFVLFITAFTRIEQYNPDFIKDLMNFVDDNISETPNFASKLETIFNSKSAEEFKNTDADNFFLIALIKYILSFLKPYNYDIKKGEAKWLMRDDQVNVTNLLHLAFHIRRYVPKTPEKRKSVGKNINKVEQKSVQFIRNDYEVLKKTSDYERLFNAHNIEIIELNSMGFELTTPEPQE